MLDPEALSKVLARVAKPRPAGFFESQHLEFKQPARSQKETFDLLADTAVCFANAEGGTIVLGINDKATVRAQALTGVAESYSVESIRRGIFDRTSPHLTTFARELEIEGNRLVVIEVPPGVLLHANTAGTATRRLGKECRPFTPDQQREVLAARGHIDWSAQPAGLAVAELSAIEFDRVRRLLRETGSELATLRDRHLLEALRLIADGDEVTNAALLLLGTEEAIAQRVPTYGYSYQYRPAAGREATSRFRQARPILAAVEALLDAVESRVEIRPLNLAGGVQLQLADYPMRAVRELVVNALVHRSYEAPGTVDLEHTPERLAVVSPGSLVAGVTPTNILTHPSTPRHRLLAEAVTASRLAERTGQGIDRAYREMLQAGKEPPAFEDSGMATRAILPGGIGNDSFVRFVADLPAELRGDVEVLLCLLFLRTRTTVDAKRLSSVIQRTPIEAQDVLERLAVEGVGITEATRSTANRTFPAYRLRSESLAVLSRAVSYRRRTVDQIDEKVLEHVREYGFITNRTLQRMLDVNVYTARNLLSDLQARGLLTKIGSARGGPGVRYGPGAKVHDAEKRL
jgi:ATP-dependent DNA helicase RecG